LLLRLISILPTYLFSQLSQPGICVTIASRAITAMDSNEFEDELTAAYVRVLRDSEVVHSSCIFYSRENSRKRCG
jgi:hypothetical protein